MPPPAQEGRAHTVVLVRGSRGTASHLCCLLISSFSTQPLLPLSHALSVTSLACTLLLGRKGEEKGGEKEEGKGGKRRKGEGRGGKGGGEEGGEEGKTHGLNVKSRSKPLSLDLIKFLSVPSNSN